MAETQHAMLKRQYGWFYQELIKLLGEADLMGFVFSGISADEYDIEVDELLLRLPEASSPNQLGQIIYEVFVKCFDIAFAPADEPEPSTERSKQLFATMGEKAWALWMRWQAEAQQN